MLTMSWDEWGMLDAVALADLVRSGKVTPRQLAQQAAEAVEIVNLKLNAVLEVFRDVVEDPYKDGMSKDGAFHGVPMLIKDWGSCMRERLQECGSLLCKGVRADHDSPLIGNFRAAGLNLVGRTATPPFAWAIVTESFINGVTRNPWNLDYSPRGSSGGSAAAVAAGIVPIAMASDGGGSTRMPAAACGLIGLKPTRGRLPLPIGSELSDHTLSEGVVTRTVRDSALALDYMSRHKLGDTLMPIANPTRPYIEEVRQNPGRLHVACSVGKWGRKVDIDPDNTAHTRRAAEVLKSLGHRVEEVRDDDICDWDIYWKHLAVPLIGEVKKFREVSGATGVPITPETLEPALYWLYRAAQKYNEFDVWHTQEANAVITRRYGQFLEKYDLLLTPSNDPCCITAGPGSGYSPLDNVKDEEGALVHMERDMDAIRYMVLANSTGTPAITVPAGIGSRRLPVGIQLHAPWLREDRLFQVAAQLEKAKPEWFNQIPRIHVSKL